MGSRKPRNKVSDMLPIWGTTETATVNLIAASIFLERGITDLPSYFQKLRIPIVICAILVPFFVHRATASGVSSLAA